MNEYYAKLEMTGEREALAHLRDQLFTHYTDDHIDEVIQQEMANPSRGGAIEYFKTRIERYRFENGGYYYLNLTVWEPIVGPEANVDLDVINDRRLRVPIATRCQPDLDKLEEISAQHPEITFTYHQCREWLPGELICVIKDGQMQDWINGDYELTEDREIVKTTRSWSADVAESRIRQRIEILNENGEWELCPLRMVDESEVYPGSAHDPVEGGPPAIFVY